MGSAGSCVGVARGLIAITRLLSDGSRSGGQDNYASQTDHWLPQLVGLPLFRICCWAHLERCSYVNDGCYCVWMLVGELSELSEFGVHTPDTPPSLPTRVRAKAEA